MNPQPPHEYPRRAGRHLARRLANFANLGDLIVLSFPNGGVPVGVELSGILQVPFDLLMMCEITFPAHDHAVVGSITCGCVRVLDYALIDRLQLSDEEIRAAILREATELARRARFYRDGQPSLEVGDHTVVVVDDGSTPCANLRDAIRLLHRQHAERVVVALPAACHEVARDLRLETAEVITLATPSSVAAVGKWQRYFPKITHHEIRRMLALVRHQDGCQEPVAIAAALPATWFPPGYGRIHFRPTAGELARV
jgi:putative phosphoribosyl transferase